MGEYFQTLIQRHYDFLLREHEKISAEEAAITRVEQANALYIASLADGMNFKGILDADNQRPHGATIAQR